MSDRSEGDIDKDTHRKTEGERYTAWVWRQVDRNYMMLKM